MYAVVKKGIVQGYSWDKNECSGIEDTEFILMTYENSPAYNNGKYINGEFYQEGEI